MASKGLKDAVNELGRFFGIRNSDAYLQGILNPNDMPKAMDPIAPDQLSSRAKILNKISGGGDGGESVELLMKEIEKATQGDNATELKVFNSDICITPAKGDYGSANATKHPLNAPKVQTPGGDDETQGVFAPGTSLETKTKAGDKLVKLSGKTSPDFYTVSDFLSVKDETPVNVIQVWPAVGNVSQSDTDVVSLFMNSIPTLELSRAVPFIDIMTVVRTGDDNTETRPLSLGRWMLGDNISAEDPFTQGIFNSEDPSMTDDGGLAKNLKTAATMEIFTAPQTMVPISPSQDSDGTLRMHSDTTKTGGAQGGSPRPLDPFQPMLSLNSLDFNVVGTGGMASFKSGQLSLTLHDKSNLGAVAPLVAPQERGSVRFIITWGWAHPDATEGFGQFQPEGRKADADSTNRYADLLNAMRISETYACMNSDFSFNDDGSVAINCKLAMVGTAALDSLSITVQSMVDVNVEMNEIFRSIRENLKAFNKRARSMGKVNVPKELRSTTHANGASNIKAEDIKKLKAWLLTRTSDPNLKQIHSLMQDLYGSGKNTTNKGMVASANNTKTAALTQMVNQLFYTPDPWLTPVGDYAKGKNAATVNKKGVSFKDAHKFDLSKANIKQVTAQTHVSLGKLLTFFVGQSLAESDQFDEVQVVFYAFNDSASYLYDANIANFPIDLADFKAMLIDKFNKTGTMSLSAFLKFLNTFFLRDQAQPGFGFTGLYAKGASAGRDKENKKKRQLKKAYNEGKKADGKPSPVLIRKFKKGILEKAYGIESTSPNCNFKPPQITLKMEALPLKTAENKPDGEKTAKQDGKTLLKIHVIDQQCQPTATLHQLFKGFGSSGYMKAKARESKRKRSPRHSEVFAAQVEALAGPEFDVIEDANPDKDTAKKLGYTEDFVKEMAEGMYYIKIDDPSQLKNKLMAMVPTLVHGGVNSAMIGAKVSSQNEPALVSVNMMRQGQTKKKDGANPSQDEGSLPLQIVPTTLDIETFGCPYFSYGQQYFVDFMTNSTADNFYGVIGVDHKIEPGQFKTNVKMAAMDAFGSFVPLLDGVKTTMLMALKAEGKKQSSK